MRSATYVAEIEELLADGSWMTVSGIASGKQAKDEPKAGIGAREQAVRQALDEHPERFERRTGEAAKVLGRHSNAHLWGVLRLGSTREHTAIPTSCVCVCVCSRPYRGADAGSRRRRCDPGGGSRRWLTC
jgi:hypothetical protein